MTRYPSHFSNEDQIIVSGKQYKRFVNLSEESCRYSKDMVNIYIENVLWISSPRNQFQLDGYQLPPKPSCNRIPIPRNTPRKQEVQLMALLYKNNVLNQCLYNLGKVPSPMCSFCQQEEETADHLLFRCGSVEEHRRQCVRRNYRLALHITDTDAEPDSYIGLLNASRNSSFIISVLDILSSLDFNVTVDL